MKNLLKSLLAICFLLNIVSANAQQSVCLGTNATACVGSSVTIQDCTPGNLGGINLTNPTFVSLTDDSYSGVVNIGFTFNFYGANYTQCVIGSNGVITFDLTEANGYCPWNLQGVGPLPSPFFDDALNAIMPAYHDMNPSASVSPTGEIMYQTMGTAPNRTFVVVYKDINAFGPPGFCTHMGVIMHETSNNIEAHIGSKPLSTGWNGGLAIQGTQNVTGTVADITPGRNNTQWVATQEARLWTPTAPGNTSSYTISTIPYQVMYANSTSLSWESTTGATYPYNGGNLIVNPVTLTANSPIGYFLTTSSSSCGLSGGSNSDTTYISPVSSAVSATGVDDICSSGQGSATAAPLNGIPTYTYSWNTPGSPTTPSVTGLTSGTYTVTMTDGNGCSSTANVTIDDTPTVFSGDSTEVSCPGGNDGTATASMTPLLGTVTYQWDDPLMQTTQTAVGLAAGQYTCTVTSSIGCQGIVVVDVTEIPGMIGVISNQQDVTCNSGSDGIVEITVTQGTGPYTYSWDNSFSTANSATDLSAGTHTVTITDANGCVITVTTTIGEPAPLSIVSLTPDTQICPEDEIVLSVTGSGGSSPYTFTWSENGVVIGTGTSITVDPDFTNTEYCVTLSEVCGSPTTNECLIITFPVPIIPSITADEYQKCMPGRFEFTNTSSNSSEIATTLFEFGNEELFIAFGADSTSHEYNAVGIYDIIVTTTSIYGCVYADTFPSFVEVKPNPVADFTFSDNPATIFETTITMQDRSSADVVTWEWISPTSTPTTSSITKPTFVFPQETGIYPVTLVVTTEHGCIDTVTFNLNVIQDILFFAPNAFTPDGDEHNQMWKPEIQGIDIYNFELLIFNRWGEVIWENHDPNIGWDGTYKGKVVDSGMYTWKSTVKSSVNDSKSEFNGTINLLK